MKAPTAVKSTVEASTTRNPGPNPHRNDAARMARKYPKKKMLLVPLLSEMRRV